LTNIGDINDNVATSLLPTNPQFRPRVEVTRLLGEIDEFKGHWRKLGEIRAERLISLRQVTTNESAGSSTRIEGAELTDEEVARVLQGLQVDSFRARDEAEVLGYAELLQTIFLTIIGRSHSPRTTSSTSTRSSWATSPRTSGIGASTRSSKTQSRRGTRMAASRSSRTASPFDTARLMAELVTATNEAIASDQLHPLIAIARFVVDFLAIHPFQDGNGRLSRAITALLLLRSGYDYVPYASVERVIEDNKVGYYHALRVSQAAMQADPTAFGEWLVFFLRVLRAQARSLSAKLEMERSILHLKDVQVKVLEHVERHGRGTAAEVARALAIDQRQARYHLGLLVEHGLLAPHGERRGRYYTRGATGAPVLRPQGETRNGAILAAVLQRGGKVSRSELRELIAAREPPNGPGA